MEKLRKILIPKKVSHFIVEFIVVGIIIAVVFINIYRASSKVPVSEFNYEIRATEEIVEVLLTNESLDVLVTSGSFEFDLYGNCYLKNGTEKVEYCDYNELNFEHSTIRFTFLDDDRLRVINVSYHLGYSITFIPSGCIDGSCWYISRGAARYNEEKEVYESLVMYPNAFVVFENCVFDPYLPGSTSCWWPSDVMRAKEAYNEYIDFLNELRVSENEVIEFSRWFMIEMEMNVNNIFSTN